ncbi:MAG: hypothetical protein NTV33_06775 [Coprothermobacterota bacterium]|nr:hypothetical protein [Coprothermobacterota bacterium]
MNDALIRLLEGEAAVEQQRILEEARSYAQETVQAARRLAENTLAEAGLRWQHWSEAEMEKSIKAQALKRQTQILEEKTRWLQVALAKAKETLANFRQDARYPEVFLRLARDFDEDGRTGAPRSQSQGDQDTWVLTVHPLDQKLLEGDLANRVIQDQTLPPGLLAQTADGKIEVRDTLADRLEKGWPILMGRAAELLWDTLPGAV